MPCPSEEEVDAFVRGDLEEAGVSALYAHAAVCTSCASLMAALRTEGDTELAMPSGDERRVGRYELRHPIGAGGMGVVYVAHDPDLDRLIAVKILRSRPGDRDRWEDRLRREAQTMARLSHPNVVTIHDVGTVRGRVFLAMELVLGTTLTRWIAEQPRTWREIVDKYVLAARGLAAAHAVGVVHRDFKPDNVLVAKDGQVRVTDFGLAGVAPSGASSAGAVQTTRGGTPAYMALEQIRGGSVDARADVFSFCAALYQSLYRERPFRGATVLELEASIASNALVVPAPTSAVPTFLFPILKRGLSASADDRYASIDAVTEALASDGRPSSARPFVGRDKELERLVRALDAIGRGGHGERDDGRIVLLVGEAGIGKTRLADEVSARAALRGVKVLWGRCWEGAGAPAYWPWAQVLRACAQDPRLAELCAGAARATPELAALVMPHGNDAAATPTADAEQARFRLFDGVASLLARASEIIPIAIVLDDLHDADVPSLLLLRFVARERRGVCLFVLGTHRAVEARSRPPVRELLAKIARDAEVLLVPRLLPEAITSWMKAALPDAAPDACEAVCRATEGNPLFVQEMLQVLESRGVASGSLEIDAIDGIREVIHEHLGRLSPDVHRLLQAAAVVGRDFDVATLAALAGATPLATEDGLREATTLGVVLRRDARDAQRLSFSHILLRDELYGSLATTERRALHRKLAGLLRRASLAGARGDRAGSLARVAHHLFEAAGADDLDETIAVAREAAAWASGLYAFEEASAILARAVETLDTHDATPDIRRCELLIELGEAQLRSGESTAGRDTCARAAECAEELGEPMLLANAALAYGTELLTTQRDETMVRLLRSALAALPPDAARLRTRVMARLGAALVPSTDYDTDKPHDLAAAALALARTLGDPATLLYALEFASGGMFASMSAAERGVLHQETVDLARSLGRDVAAVPAASWLVADTLDVSGPAASDRAIEQLASLLTKLPQAHYQLRLPLIRAGRAALAGRFEESDRLGRAALALAKQSENKKALALFAFQRVGLQHARGDLQGFGDVEPGILEVFRGVGGAGRIFSAILCALAGRRDEGRALIAPAIGYGVADALAACGSVALACVALDAPAHAPAMYAALKKHDGRNPLIWLPSAVGCLGPTSLALAGLAVMLEENDAAARHYEDAIAFAERIGAAPYLERARRDYAKLKDGARATVVAKPSKPAPARAPLVASLAQEGHLWRLSMGDRSIMLRASKGLAYLDALLRAPHQEVHVAQLVGIGDGDGGDAGPMLDAEAKDAYRRRAGDLRDAIAEAEGFRDAARASKARAELDALAEELARAVGLGGRDRKAVSSLERARVNVQRRVRDAIAKVSEQDPELGRHLDLFVKTGAFCTYAPG